MTRQQAKELLPIIEAFASGKDIQWRPHNKSIEWATVDQNADCFREIFTTCDYSYRIKPPKSEAEQAFDEWASIRPLGSNISRDLAMVVYLAGWKARQEADKL